MFMRPGTAVLRTLVGALFMGHGLQKLAGWFGGYGLTATGGAFEQMGLKPGKVHATAAGVAETAGGALMVTGKATPLAATMLTGTMTTAIEKVHLQKGIWAQDGGFEYPAVLIAAAFAVVAEEESLRWALAELAVGVAGGLAVAKLAARAPEAADSTERFQREEQTAAATTAA
jgi:putative oxidoreductase